MNFASLPIVEEIGVKKVEETPLEEPAAARDSRLRLNSTEVLRLLNSSERAAVIYSRPECFDGLNAKGPAITPALRDWKTSL
jgi:hypothetical protein